MSVFSRWAPRLWSLGLCSVLALFTGCNGPETISPPDYRDDFGDQLDVEPITEQSVAEETMLHQHAQFQLSAGVGIPVESNFDIGPRIDGKFSIEVFKNVYLGLSAGWSNHEIGDGATDGNPQNNDATQLYDSFDRLSFLGHLDYDIPLTRPQSEPGAWTLRLGLGAGLLALLPEEDSFLESSLAGAGGDYEVVDFFGFVLRPQVQIRYRVWENGHVIGTLSYDFVPENRVDIKVNGQRREVRDDLQLDNINLGVGFVFEW